MEVQHTRSSDTGAEGVVYTFLLSRGCSEERHYGTVSKIQKDVDGTGRESGFMTCFSSLSLGLRAAEMTALPSDIIQEAKTIASKVSQQLLVGLCNDHIFF